MKKTNIKISIVTMMIAFSISINPVFANNMLENAELSAIIQQDDKNQFSEINRDDELNIDWDEIDITSNNEEEFSGPKSAANRQQTRASGQWIQAADGRWWYKHSIGQRQRNMEHIGDSNNKLYRKLD